MRLFNLKKSILGSGVLASAVDCHSHILYGVDDGVRDLAESLRILDYMESAGLSDLWLTPHVMEDVPNTTESLQKRFAELCLSYHGAVRLHLAAEYMMDSLLMERADAGDLLTMDDNTVLVETSVWRAPENWEYIFEKLKSRGYRPLFAHVERYQYIRTEDYDRLYRLGIGMQLNYGSLTGFYGETARRRAHSLLAKGYYSCFGSDCHRLKNVERQLDTPCLRRKEIESLRLISGK